MVELKPAIAVFSEAVDAVELQGPLCTLPECPSCQKAAAIIEADRLAVAKKVREACAREMEKLYFITDIDDLIVLTKQQVSALTCRHGAAAIRALDLSTIIGCDNGAA